MTLAPDVSLIMANYNGAAYLPDAIRSAIAQSHKSWELVIADDASTDDSVRVAEEAANGDPRITIERLSNNAGAGAARNRALGMARGTWIAIFDSDDLMEPQRLEALLKRAGDDNAVIIADNLLVFSESFPPRPFLPARSTARGARWIETAAFIDSGRLYSKTPDLGYLKPLVRAELLRKTGIRYDESLRIGEDYNFLLRLMAAGHGLRLEPRALYRYRKHAQSVSHRLKASDIAALLIADRRFSETAPRLASGVQKALLRRRRALQTLLAYDHIVSALKRGAFAEAASIALSHPQAWPLLTRPVEARIKRLAGKLTRASPPALMKPSLPEVSVTTLDHVRPSAIASADSPLH